MLTIIISTRIIKYGTFTIFPSRRDWNKKNILVYFDIGNLYFNLIKNKNPDLTWKIYFWWYLNYPGIKIITWFTQTRWYYTIVLKVCFDFHQIGCKIMAKKNRPKIVIMARKIVLRLWCSLHILKGKITPFVPVISCHLS